MKRIMIVLLVLAVLLSLSACSSSQSYEEWHNEQVDRGVKEAQRILGR